MVDHVFLDHVLLLEHLDGVEILSGALLGQKHFPKGTSADQLDDLKVLDARPVLFQLPCSGFLLLQ